MMSIALAVVLFLSFSQGINAAPKIEIIDTLDDYKIFLSNIKNAKGNKQKQVAAFDSYQTKYTNIFNKEVYDLYWKDNKETVLKRYFKKLPNIENKTIKLFSKARNIISTVPDSFGKIFTDFKGEQNYHLKVYLTPLFTGTNGITPGTFNGVSLILLGIDGFIMQGQNENDLKYVFAHEFFHFYWKAIKHKNNDYEDKFDTKLWGEGFATYASGLVTGLPDEVVLADPELGARCKDPLYIKDLARKFKIFVTTEQDELIKTKNENALTKFDKEWFSFSHNKKRSKEVPARPGYCLGLEIVKKLAKKSTLEEMVNWKGADLTRRIRSELDNIINKQPLNRR